MYGIIIVQLFIIALLLGYIGEQHEKHLRWKRAYKRWKSAFEKLNEQYKLIRGEQ